MFAIQMTAKTTTVYMNAHGQWSSQTVCRLFETEAHAQATLDGMRLRAGMRQHSKVVPVTAADLTVMTEDAAVCLEAATKHGTFADQLEWRNRFNRLQSLAA